MAESRQTARIAPGAEVGRWRCKNHDNSASADSPIDFVTDAGLLPVQEFNKWVQFTVIDVEDMKVLSGLAKAIKPTRLLAKVQVKGPDVIVMRPEKKSR